MLHVYEYLWSKRLAYAHEDFLPNFKVKYTGNALDFARKQQIPTITR